MTESQVVIGQIDSQLMIHAYSGEVSDLKSLKALYIMGSPYEYR